MKKLRAKFSVREVVDSEYGENVRLDAVYGTDDKDNEENNQFAEATPSGYLEQFISNSEALGFFKEGKSYYLDFTEAPE